MSAPAKDMMIVAIDYFTKWIEAETLSSTKEADVDHCIFCEVGHQIALVNSKISIGQWPSRAIQQDRAGLPDDKTGRCRRKVGQRATRSPTRSPMGLSHNQKKINQRDNIFPSLRDRGNHPPTHHSSHWLTSYYNKKAKINSTLRPCA
ncbi:unnamed protein product [Prunus brigantina]